MTLSFAMWMLVLSGIGRVSAQEPELALVCAEPRACIEHLHGGLVSLSQGSGEADLQTRYERLEPLITATHDLPYIAKFAVRRQWEDFSAEEQQAFVAAFERLSVMTYAARFVTLSEDTFRILEVSDTGEGRAQVVASIARQELPDVPMEYLLQAGPDGWRIVNVIADGVSDLALKRAEYRQILTDGSPADLITHLERQIASLM